mgnify:CR=1 FL=1
MLQTKLGNYGRKLFTLSIFRQDKAKIVDKSVWNRFGFTLQRVKHKDVFHQKTQFTCVNEHFETIFNAGMAKKTTREMFSYSSSPCFAR